MTVKKITSKDIVAEVRRLANERPDFVYTDQEEYDWDYCYYNGANPQGQGEGCIVGQAMRNMGHPVPDDLDGEPAHSAVESVLGRESVSRDHLSFLTTVQSYQDNARSWGYALKATEEDSRYERV